MKDIVRFALAEKGSIKARVVRSGIWVTVSQLLGSALNIVRSVVLARLLTPEAFGIMGLASVALRAVETVTRAGIAQALIARTSSFDDAAGTAFTLLVLRGVLLAALLAALAPLVADFYDTDVLTPILRVLSLVFVAGSLNSINVIARQKELDFRQLTFLNLTATTLGTVVTIVAAFSLRSVWALVIGQLATTALSSLMSYLFVGGRPRFAWNGHVARDLLQYGKFITGSSIVLFAASELDSAVIGKLLGVEQLGFYALAATIAGMATANVSRLVSGIMMPAYSKLQSDLEGLRRAFVRTLELLAFVVIPASVGLMVLAEPIVRLVYGEKWLPAVIPLQLLAVFGLFRALASFNGYLFEGMGKPKVAFQLGMIRLLTVLPLVLWLTGQFGIEGAAIGVVIGIAVQWLTGLRYLRRHLELRATQFFTTMLRPAATTALTAAAVSLFVALYGQSSLLHLIGAIAVGAISYVALNFRKLRSLAEVLRP